MKLSDFDYNLPKELIAQEPLKKRDASRLLVVDRENNEICHKKFTDLIDYLHKGDLLVFNDTKVIPARLFGNKKETGGKVEVFLLNRLAKNRYTCLINSNRPSLVGAEFLFNNKIEAKVINKNCGTSVVEFKIGDLEKVLNKIGNIPLPPYIKRMPVESDKARYQTVFAKKKGAVAAPTAGLHFTKAVLQRLKRKGVKIAFTTLHVGLGTFKPVIVEDITKHNMHEEYFEIPVKTIELIKKSKESGERVVAVGTTTVRALESVYETLLVCGERLAVSAENRKPKTENRICGWTKLFIYPGYKFKIIDALITNFHMPKTTLLMMVRAFIDQRPKTKDQRPKNLLMKAYQEAIDKKYRLLSYGDCMLII